MQKRLKKIIDKIEKINDSEAFLENKQLLLDELKQFQVETDEIKFEYRKSNNEITALLSKLNKTNSDLEKASHNLKIRAEELSTILKTIPAFVFFKDINLKYILVNDHYSDLIGITPDQIVGKSICDIFPDYDCDKYLEKERTIINSGKVIYDIEESISFKGKTFYVNTSIAPIRSIDGNITGIIGISWDISQRKIVENSLKESEEKYRTLIDNSFEGILIITFQGEILYVNKTIIKMLADDKNRDIIGLSVFEFISPESAPTAIEDFLNVALGKDSYIAEYELLVFGKRKVFVESIGKIIEYNGIKTIMVFLRDITSQRIAKEELLESEMLQRTLIENISVGVLIIDPETRIIESINSFACNIIGKPENEIIGKRCHSFICPSEENSCPICDLSQIIDNSDKTIIRSDGTIIPILKTVKKINIKGKEKLLESFIDITLRKKAEEQIEKFASDMENKNKELKIEIEYRRKAEEEVNNLALLQSILMNIASGYINIDSRNVDQSILKSLAELSAFIEADRGYLFTYNSEEDTASCLYEWCREGIESTVLHLKNIPNSSHPQWVNAHFKGETLYINNISSFDEDNRVKEVLKGNKVQTLISIPIMDGEKCLGFVGFDSVKKRHDYSENEKRLLFVFTQILLNFLKRTSLEESLIKEKENANLANKAKSEFLANMSHEIRTPMNAILGFSEIMLNTSNDDKQKSFLKTILDSGKTLLSLINDILDLSKIEAGRMDISLDSTDIKVVFAELKQIFRQKIEEKGLELIITNDPEIPESFLMDEVRLRQILLNLIGNSIKFTHKGFIKVETTLIRKEENGKFDYEITVQDTGIGISDTYKDKIFEAFTQQEGQDTKTYGGTGLGLTITKKLCELMNGEIRLESCLGSGSKFILTFKNVESMGSVIEKQDQYFWSEEIIKFKFATILIVDDIPHNRSLIKAFLENYDFSLIEAENGNIAVNYVKMYKPDLVLMDIRMPIMGGYEATEVLKNNPDFAAIPIIALTASTMTSEIERVTKLFDGYIRKPVQRKILITELMKFLPYTRISEKMTSEEEETKKAAELRSSVQMKKELSDEIKTIFKKEYLEAVENQADVISIADLRELISSLKIFLENNNLNECRKMLDELNESFKSFDFEDVQRKLLKLKEIFR